MKYDQRVVAFIDILGFKNCVDASEKSDTEFERIVDTLTELRQFFTQPKSRHDKLANKFLRADTQIVQISDSLIISRPAQEKGGVRSMLLDCSFAIHILINHGFLCRGAIRIGPMYHKDTTLFGNGYVSAYLAESAERLPIVKFDQEVFDLARQNPGVANEGYEDWEIGFIKKDCKELMTGVFYLDYFNDYDSRVGGGEGTASIHYAKLREIIANGLKLGKKSSAYEKYRWAADQFNITAHNYRLEPI